jgi:hypothetical protein
VNDGVDGEIDCRNNDSDGSKVMLEINAQVRGELVDAAEVLGSAGCTED